MSRKKTNVRVSVRKLKLKVHYTVGGAGGMSEKD